MARKPSSLVLLPPPPEPASLAALSAAYRPALDMALQKTSNKSQAAMLVVAVSYPYREGFSWAPAQELLAGLYSLIVVQCKEQHIETGLDDGPGSVDARVVFLDNGSAKDGRSSRNNTVILDLATFAAMRYDSPWDAIFYLESKAGLQLRDQYLKSVPQVSDIKAVAVAGGLTLRAGSGQDISKIPSSTTLHKTVCLGGTFDYLHPGHKLLLTAGALLLHVPQTPSSTSQSPIQQCNYVIGITGDELLRNKKYAELVQPWNKRAQAVADFLSTILDVYSGNTSPCPIEATDGELRATFRNGAIAVQCVRINDAYGPTIERKDITCLVVSGETQSGGSAVNRKREEQGWQGLATFVVDVLSADGIAEGTKTANKTAVDSVATTTTESFHDKISSSEIRKRRAERAAAAF